MNGRPLLVQMVVTVLEFNGSYYFHINRQTLRKAGLKEGDIVRMTLLEVADGK